MSRPNLSAIQDTQASAALQTLHVRLSAIERLGQAPRTIDTPTATVDAGGRRVTNLADPTGTGDAVNKRTADLLIRTALNSELAALGVNPDGSTVLHPGIGAGITFASL